MAAYAAGGAAAAAALCAGITGCGVCIGGITALALIPLYIRKSDSSDNGRTSLNKVIGSNITLESHTSAVIALAVFNNLMASGSRNGEIIIWDAIKWEPTTRKISVAGEINGLKFVDGFSLVSISSSGGLIFWDTQTGDDKFTFKNNLLGIMNSLAINSQRQEVIISTSRRYILIFSRLGDKLDQFTVSRSINYIQINSNQDLVIQLDTSIQFYKNSKFKSELPVTTGMDALAVTAASKGVGESIIYSNRDSMEILDSTNTNDKKLITTGDNVLFISQLSNGLLVSAVKDSLFFYNLASFSQVNSVKELPTEITSMVVRGTDVILGTSLNLIIVLNNTFVENNAEFPEPEEPKLIPITKKAHSRKVTTFDTNNDDLIISGSLDGSVVFTNRSTTQIMNTFQFSESIVHVKFDDPFVLVVSSGGNLSKIHSTTFSLDNSVKLTETVKSAQLIKSDILVGTATGFFRVYHKDSLEKIRDLPKSDKPIDVIANLNGNFSSSSENELKIWKSDFSLLRGPIDTTSKVMAIFMLSNKNVVTIGQDGLIVVWEDPNYDRLPDSKISGSNVQVTSAVIANSGNIFIALKNSIIEYDLLNKIEVGVDLIKATQIIIDRFQELLIGMENGTIIFRVTEIINPVTETTQQEITTKLILNKSRQSSSLSNFTTVDDTSATITNKQKITLESELTTLNEQTSTKYNQTSRETNNPTTLTYQSSFLSSLLEALTETIPETQPVTNTQKNEFTTETINSTTDLQKLTEFLPTLITFEEQTSTKSSQASRETNNPTTLTYQSSFLSSLLEALTETIPKTQPVTNTQKNEFGTEKINSTTDLQKRTEFLPVLTNSANLTSAA